MRLDKLLVNQQLFPSREKAQLSISQKLVKVNGIIVDKPSKEIPETATIDIIDIFNKYVSRGGLKLEKAIHEFNLDFSDKTVLDIGASTGGFTHCALTHGARSVFAVDVGTGQLHPSLAQNPNVSFLENKDFRNLTPEEAIGTPFDFIVSDVSFISLTYLMPYFGSFLKPDGQMMLLIKPQFEAGPSFLNRSGIVTDEKGYKVAIRRVIDEAALFKIHLNQISISTLFEKNKNIEFISLFSLNNTNYKPSYNTLFTDIKEIRKKIL